MENRTRKVMKPFLVIVGLALISCVQAQEVAGGGSEPAENSHEAVTLPEVPQLVPSVMPWKYVKNLDAAEAVVFHAPSGPHARNPDAAEALVFQAPSSPYAQNFDASRVLVFQAPSGPYAQNLDASRALVFQASSGPYAQRLPDAAIAKGMDAFYRKLAFEWVKPEEEYMNTLLKEIAEAAQAGDTTTYQRLTTTYTIWASKALLRGKPRLVTDSSP